MSDHFLYFLLGAIFSRYWLEPFSEFVTSKVINKLKK